MHRQMNVFPGPPLFLHNGGFNKQGNILVCLDVDNHFKVVYRGRLRLLLWLPGLTPSITPVVTEPVDLDEAVVQNSFCALHGPLSLLRRGKLDQRSLRVVLISHL